ncbi:MAG: HAD family phosphatase [Saprospirales bacterium]|jgi:HAD superfamily hydrolase (TIGR01509 family)|nr:HAD family phosphatase [Saprospirales bacterium]MBK8923520.1 HAD family phosphatase [Saprospirales bacterium]
MPTVKHLLFDNDGTIVDSEVIAVRSMLQMLAAQGLQLTEKEYCQRFPGLTLRDIMGILAEEFGLREADDLLERARQEHIRLFESELRVVPGMYGLFRRLQTPKSMVSNGSIRHVERSLRRVRLLRALDGHIFSAEQVRRPKPFPDVYQYALETLQLPPAEVLVVEDSPVGVQAAKSAGLPVIGFLGATHVTAGHADALLAEGADFIAENATELGKLLNKHGIL